jgi:hypothetical protein
MKTWNVNVKRTAASATTATALEIVIAVNATGTPSEDIRAEEAVHQSQTRTKRIDERLWPIEKFATVRQEKSVYRPPLETVTSTSVSLVGTPKAV